MPFDFSKADLGDRPQRTMPAMVHLPPSETGAPPNQYPLFREEYNIVGPLVENLQFILMGCVATSVVTLAGTLFFNDVLPKWAKTTALSFSVASASVAPLLLTLSGNETLMRMKGAIQEARENQIRNHLNSEIVKDKIVAEMSNNDWHVRAIMQLPVEQQLFYLKRHNLQELVPWYVEAVKEVAPPPPVTIMQGHQETINDAATMSSDLINFNWVDQQFVEGSKGIFGASGSGKTRVMAILVYEWLRYNPDGEIRIIDPHFSDRPDDPSELSNDDSLWFLGVPDNIVKDYYVVSLAGDSKGKDQGNEGFVRRTVAMYERALRIMDYRKQHGMKFGNKKYKEMGGYRFHLINDEFFATLKTIAHISKKHAERIITIISLLRFEGRKYGVDITLGLHSLKKGSVDIDSDVLLGNLSLLFLGAALNDPNTPLPTDLGDQRIETYNAMVQLQEVLAPKQGYACAVRKMGTASTGNKRIQVEVIPHIEFQDVWFNYIPANSHPTIDVAIQETGEDLHTPSDSTQAENQTPTKSNGQINFKEIFKTLRELYQTKKGDMTDEQIIKQFEELSGTPINPNAIEALLQVVKGVDPIE